MRDLNQTTSDTNTRIAVAFRHSIWLTYLLTLGTISAGGLSIFSIATLLKTNSAQAKETEPTAIPGNIEETSNLISSGSNQTIQTINLEKSQIQSKEDLSKTDQNTLTLHQKSEPVVLAETPVKLPVFTEQSQPETTNFNFAPEVIPALNIAKSNSPIVPEQPTAYSAFTAPVPEQTEVNHPQIVLEQKAAYSAFTPPVPEQTAVNKVSQIALEPKPSSTASPSTIHSAPGSAALLEGTLQAQSSRDTPQQTPAPLETAPLNINPLAPTLVFQGVVINQGDTSARARLTGIYPFSPNALVGGTIEAGTGPDFSDPQAGTLRVNELYFTGNLPSYPNLRLTAGLVDLTSYFDRNSFAKDAATQFFNPAFQTNPALSATGLASRPAALLNWNITDNLEAKVAGFSSAQSIGNFALDGFAGEIGFRAGNGIIRATYVTDRDVERNGFKEIYGIPRSPGEVGPRSSDRESSYGINGEYFFPEIKMGVFGRYGRYENTSIGRGGDTYSVGLNFLDLFLRDDRLGFGYGRNLSNDELRRQTGAKVPDVWELFYDVRLSPILRAAVSLQERNQFTETVLGFRIKTEFDVTSLLGKVFR